MSDLSAAADPGTTAAPKPRATNRATDSEVPSSNAMRRWTPAASNASSTCRRSPDSARISTNEACSANSASPTSPTGANGWSRATMPTNGSAASSRWTRSDGTCSANRPTNARSSVAAADLVGHPGAAGVGDGDLHRGMAAVELGQRLLDGRRGLGRTADHAEPQPTGHHPGQLRELGPGQIQLGEHPPRPDQQQITGGGQPHRAAGALEEHHPVLPFEPGDLIAQRGLDDVAARRGPGEAQLLGHRDKIFELSNIHLNPR